MSNEEKLKDIVAMQKEYARLYPSCLCGVDQNGVHVTEKFFNETFGDMEYIETARYNSAFPYEKSFVYDGVKFYCIY